MGVLRALCPVIFMSLHRWMRCSALQIMFHLVMFPAAGARWRTSKQG
jgi:hypothetical protein